MCNTKGEAVTPRLLQIAADATQLIQTHIANMITFAVTCEDSTLADLAAENSERIVHGIVKRAVMETELLLTEDERKRASAKLAAKAARRSHYAR